jgi:hypothetical protein
LNFLDQPTTFIKTNRNVLREILADALETVSLANAIADGRNDDFVL